MWLSGLRGGVAFAIAALSYKKLDFPQHCGGLAWEAPWGGGTSAAAADDCERNEVVSHDSLALLQMTTIIAVFTTFLLGGAMPTIAQRCGVMLPAELIPKALDSAEEAASTIGELSCTGSAKTSPRPPTLQRGMSNRAEPLLYARGSTCDSLSVPLWRSAGALGDAQHDEGSPTSVRSSIPFIEQRHAWLVRFLTHEEDYQYLENEVEDRLIGRGGIYHANLANDSAPPRRLSLSIRRSSASATTPAVSLSARYSEYEPPGAE